ncbi:Glycosyl transferase family 2 [Butyrivibrio fibrisolvens DSM 3071]|uniref:Glycosyl transferase family 2 n=1 Tax=Butyrivibrio fibrisolvens DSM 3071 TaxID=1121131 RepID=A0A1M6EU48_BUTFI|nr:glycosyltransferase family 2 protein [Butyrivibrio fibrisolvens]SHI88957.1 Glycosyl transferase family 2 [Butyrivibrio fibrisolvens DSM 3071]
MRPFFSIVIPTYNSERTLEYTLKSIRSQKFDQNDLEILVIDGGSTDLTLEIARKYGAVILDNPKRLPEYAKAIGAEKATGKYLMRMDSDEEFSYDTQLQDKKDLLDQYDVKVLISDTIGNGRKELCGVSAVYSNALGDPFSYFIYKVKSSKYETYKKNVIKENGKNAIMQFDEGDLLPLADAATCVMSLDYIREKYPEKYSSIEFTCSAFDQIISDTHTCGIVRGDNTMHNCSSKFKTYLSKLKFRVINNLFNKQESGFSSRESGTKILTKRKYLFVLYAAIIPLPILDSIRLAIVYKHWSFLLHFVYLYYVCFEIFILGIAKKLNFNISNNNYGK